MKSPVFCDPNKRSDDSFLFLFFPFVAGLIFFRFFGRSLPGFSLQLFLPGLVFLIYAASSVYGSFTCPPLFFLFGCCAAFALPSFPLDEREKGAVISLASYALWFPAVFACGQLTIRQSYALRHGKAISENFASCFLTSTRQLLLLLSAQLFSVYLKHR